MKAIIALGANLGDKEATLLQAIRAIEKRIGKILACSTFIETAALLQPGDTTSQPNFLNGAVLVETTLAPELVLKELLEIEKLLGRVRTDKGIRWAPRKIDLDLICADEVIIDTPFLSLPHPEMHKRRFVLEPMAEIWGGWRHPLLKSTALDLLKALKS